MGNRFVLPGPFTPPRVTFPSRAEEAEEEKAKEITKPAPATPPADPGGAGHEPEVIRGFEGGVFDPAGGGGGSTTAQKAIAALGGMMIGGPFGLALGAAPWIADVVNHGPEHALENSLMGRAARGLLGGEEAPKAAEQPAASPWDNYMTPASQGNVAQSPAMMGPAMGPAMVSHETPAAGGYGAGNAVDGGGGFLGAPTDELGYMWEFSPDGSYDYASDQAMQAAVEQAAMEEAAMMAAFDEMYGAGGNDDESWDDSYDWGSDGDGGGWF